VPVKSQTPAEAWWHRWYSCASSLVWSHGFHSRWSEFQRVASPLFGIDPCSVTFLTSVTAFVIEIFKKIKIRWLSSTLTYPANSNARGNVRWHGGRLSQEQQGPTTSKNQINGRVFFYTSSWNQIEGMRNDIAIV
jgi:hypothetical protein